MIRLRDSRAASGYVKFIDDGNPTSLSASRGEKPLTAGERASAFQTKSVGTRAAIILAGPLANFLLAIVLYAGLNAVVGVRVLPAYVDAVVANSPAARAGFMPGDKIVAIITGDEVAYDLSQSRGPRLKSLWQEYEEVLGETRNV